MTKRCFRVAMICNYLPSNSKMGTGYQAHAMANHLVRRGNEVVLFSPAPRPADALYGHRSVDVGQSLRTFRFAWNLRKIDFSGFDVIHAHGDNYWLWSRRHRPPVIRTMHGSCLAEAWKVPGIKEKLRMLLLYAAEVLATLVSDKTVCVSANTLKYYPGLKEVIPNGVDVAAFRPDSTNNEQRTTNSAAAALRSTDNEQKFIPARRETTNNDDAAVAAKNPESGIQNPEDAECQIPNAQYSPSAALPRHSRFEVTGYGLQGAGEELEGGTNRQLEPAVRNTECTENTANPESTGPVTCNLSSVTSRGGKAATPTILFVGTFGNRKRGKLLMELFARDILPALPAAQLWMVCSDAPAAAGVTVFGRIPEEQLTDLYRRAWVFCLPSTYEGFGIPYIEAMASGTAVVASPNVGAVEVTRNGKDGMVVEDDKLGATLLNVLTDENLRHKLEAAGLERVKDFDLNKVCEQYEKIYQSVM